jgi:predicted amidohydrolase
MTALRAGYFQFRPVFGQPESNLKAVIAALKSVKADLMVLPELAFTGYYFADRREAMRLSEDVRKSRIVESLTALCRRNGMHLVTGFAERRKDKCFNASLLIGPEGLRHVYRKLHLFNQEKEWFDPGDTPLAVHRIGDARIGMMICFDWVFPEVTRSLALQGAHVIAHPSNLVLNFCQDAMVTRCIENSVFAVTANRYGNDRRPHGNLKFTGQSQITAPKGVILRRAPAQKSERHVVALDLAWAENKRITPMKDLLKDRRPAFYAR